MQGNAVINDITAAELAKILKNAKDGVVELDKDYDVIDDWTSLTDLPVSSKEVYTLNGNGHTITGLTKPLFGANPARGVVINGLTIADSDIGSGTVNETNSGAFVAYMDGYCYNGLSLDNCHTNNVNVTAKNADGYKAYGAGSLVGFFAVGTKNASLTIKDCTVIGGSVINKDKNAGGIVGMCQTVDETTFKIENCKVNGCAINGKEKTGELVGMVNGGSTLYIDKCTYVGNAYGCIYKGAMVVIDGVPHVTTLEQFSNAVNGSYAKVVLAADITNDTVPYNAGQSGFTYTLTGKELTIDLAGHTFATAVNAFLVQYSSVLTLESSSPNGKILFNKTFDDSNAQRSSCGIKIYAQGTLNISANVVLENNVYVEGLLKTVQNGNTVNMNGGELIVYNSYAHMAQSGTFNMNGGKITLKSATNDGYSTAFYLMGTKLYLNGGTVEGTGYVYEKGLGCTVTQDENSSFSYNTTGGLQK